MIDKLSKTTVTVIFGLAFLLSQSVILSILIKLNLKDVFVLQTTFDSSVFSTIVNQWESDGVNHHYFNHYYLDFLHPIFYSVFLASLLSKPLNRGLVSDKFSFVIVFPFIAGLFDLVENVLHLHMILNGSYMSGIVVFSATLSHLKWFLCLICLLIWLVWITNGYKKR
ncbi:hypothetical protein [Oceanobacillus rekensis]|uniref:hypothetical protein n=1 Tax=Oceanobacillus rekensis TaxID=937927 RepID=UPI0015933790|nr:hypothetical protein [Oceanobacillus rekensis]